MNESQLDGVHWTNTRFNAGELTHLSQLITRNHSLPISTFLSIWQTRWRMSRRVQIDDSKPQPLENEDVPEDESSPAQPDEPEEKLRKRDYIDIYSHRNLMRLLHKQGDQIVLFADKVLKFTGSGKMKHRYLMITDFAIYLLDPETDSLKRRIALAAVEKICVSELADNFLVVIIPTEYDLLIASARKTEIITAFIEAYEPEIVSSNRFEYNAASNLVKAIEFEEVEGGVKTRILRK